MKDYTEEIRTNLKLYRVNYPMTQKQLADKSGVCARSITHFENGGDITLQNLAKLLDALGLADNLAGLVPNQSVRPSAYLKTEKQRQRASVKKQNKQATEFKWGDEE